MTSPAQFSSFPSGSLGEEAAVAQESAESAPLTHPRGSMGEEVEQPQVQQHRMTEDGNG